MKTDWEKYYRTVSPFAALSRKIISKSAANILQRCAPSQNPDILEIGGGNSCCAALFKKTFKPKSYSVIDSSPLGCKLLNQNMPDIVTVCRDVLSVPAEKKHDIVFSVGLIEHFSETERKKIISRHFDFCKAGGIVMMTFPTPSLTYRLTRRAAELAGVWNFPDETPLLIDDVSVHLENRKILAEKTTYLNLLSQIMIAVSER